MADEPTASGTIDIAADPKIVYDLVSDLPRMGEWSPENCGGTWKGGATGPAVGAKFKGKNKNGWRSWSTDVTVTEASPPESFAFRCAVKGMQTAEWSYRITPTATGCTVTESTTDKRSGLIAAIGNRVSGRKDRAGFNRTSIETTLSNLKKAAEGN